jgi:hypothetical protein
MKNLTRTFLSPGCVECFVDGPIMIDKGLNRQCHNKPEYSPEELCLGSPYSGQLYIGCYTILQRDKKCTGFTMDHPHQYEFVPVCRQGFCRLDLLIPNE